MGIALNIKRLRIEKKMSQKQLAAAIGVTNGSIANYENEVSEPDLNKMQKICKVLGVTLDELTTVKPQQNNYDTPENEMQIINEPQNNYPMNDYVLRKDYEFLQNELKEKNEIIKHLLAMEPAESKKKEAV